MSSTALIASGEFARLSGLSRKALRYYEEQGLLLPAQVNAQTGYRAYDPASLRLARRITALRAMGMSVEEIVRINRLESEGVPAEAVRLIHEHWGRQVQALEGFHRLYHQEVSQVLGMEGSRHAVSSCPIEPGPVLALRKTIRSAELEAWLAEGSKRLAEHLAQNALQPRARSFVRFDGILSPETGIEVLVCQPVTSLCPQDGDLFCWQDEARQGAHVTIRHEDMPYPRHLVPIETLYLWLAQHRKVHWGYSLRAGFDSASLRFDELLVPYHDAESDKIAFASPDEVWQTSA